ncbi:DUF1569 domain-containing protein [Olleya namhaensis]|uniref:DinB superfamily protein n=1 Tax=Olleya namhaensis TaxID=1144750 RepID=A0A1I3LQD6_9FLAO|nr:DUF1569 domain-containing protein [Olleya namhaensis]SFI86958.1 hypothetical protein SAMN05443431_102525 [Olleya namhaensis]
MTLKKLTTVLDTLESHIQNQDTSNTKISKENVAWHIDHSLKVINNVSTALKTSDPNTYSNNFSLLGKVFFTLGFFPRGKAKAPKHVKPPEIILKKDLIAQINEAKANIGTISSLDKNAHFKHPIFGNVNTKRVPRFLIIHTTHHLKIINDILK